MTRRPLTINLDGHLLDVAVRQASRDGVGIDDLVEQSLRFFFGLRGVAVLEGQEERRAVGLSDDEAMELAVGEVKAVRAERRKAQ